MKSLITKLFNRHGVRALVQFILVVFILALAAFFPLRVLSVALHVGENNLSNDYLAFTNPVIQIANKGMQINDLYKTCFGIQCEPLTLIVMALGVHFFDWNVHAEIIFSVLTTVVTMVLLYVSIAGISLKLERLWLLTFISAFLFSFTLMATYTFGQAAIYTTLAFFGVALGIFAIKIFPNTTKGLILLVAGMWIAVWTYGGGLFSIPIALWGLQVGFRNTKYWVLWSLSLMIIGLPYLEFFIHSSSPSVTGATNIISFFRIHWILKLLGSFFSNGLWLPYPGKELLFISSPILYGIIGSLFFCLGIILIIYNYGWRGFSAFYAEGSLILFGLGSVWLASIFRDGIAPWYVSNTMPFWLGLVTLYCSFVFKIQGNIGKLVQWITFSLLLFTTSLFLHSNLTYEDKIFHLLTRAPVSASCLRNSSTAPTYCEPFLFQWSLGNPKMIFMLGQPLRENKLSVFSSKQQWTLQGDYILDSVKISPSATGINPYWVDASGTILNWGSYHRLNLVIPSGATVNWNIQIPKQATTLNFRTQFEISREPSSQFDENSFFILNVNIVGEDGHLYTNVFKLSGSDVRNDVEFLPITIPLEQFSGQKIRLSLSTQGSYSDTAHAVLVAPLIDAITNDEFPSGESTYQPENVHSLKPSAFNFDFWPVQNGQLILNKIENDKYNFYQKTDNASILFEPKTKPCIYDSTNLYITISIDEKISNRYGYFVLKLKDQTGKIETSVFLLPYLEDGQKHTYIYPLKLHLLTSPSYLETLEVRPIGYPGKASFRIEKIGLFDDESNPQCYFYSH